MSAKEMFEKLGYEAKYYIDKSQLIFIGYTTEDKEVEDCEILFNAKAKVFLSVNWIDKKMYEAINKQIEELGWNNE